MITESMELESDYENVEELIECQSGKTGGNRESLKPECRVQPMELARRNLSLRVIYALLGVCILLSVVAIVTAVMLISAIHENTLSTFAKLQDEILQLNNNTSIADVKNELSQWKSNSIKNSEQTLSSIAKIEDKISQLTENTATSIAGVKNELSQWKSNVADKFTNTGSSITKLQDDILEWSNNRLRCPTQWTRFRESCYHFSSSTDTWVEAQRRCALVDAHLLVINNAEEQHQIYLKVYHNYWIGLNDIVQEGMWRWVDGTDYPSSVKFWESSQPNGGEEFNEDCVVMGQDGLWHDWPCDSMHFAICEKRAT